MDEKQTRRRRIRNTALMVSGVVAVGLGCYFGSKKGFEAIAKTMRTLERDLKDVSIEMANAVDIMESEQHYRANQIANINEAIRQGIPFKHYPGLGVRFDSGKDLEKVEGGIGGVRGVK